MKKLLQMRNICCCKVHGERAISPACTADVAAERMCTCKLEMNSPRHRDNYPLQYVLFQIIKSGSSGKGEEKKKVVVLFF